MRTERRRPAGLVGQLFASLLLVLGTLNVAATETTEQLLQRADQIKYIHNDEYLSILGKLDAQQNQLTALQRDWLAYFRAWQLGYSGDYERALSAFQALLAHVQDPTLRARARISLIYDQVNAARLEDAYASIGELLDSLPDIDNRNAHFLILTTAAELYGKAGQSDLASSYIEQMLAYDPGDRSVCFALSSQVNLLQGDGKLQGSEPLIRRGIDACERIGDLLYANDIRTHVAESLVDHGRAREAIEMLEPHEAEVLAIRSAELTSGFRSALARAYLAANAFDKAQQEAQSAIQSANTQSNARSVAAAYKVLYEVAKIQGEDKAALNWHEKYAAADKGYLNDVSTRALAYQKVHQQVLDNQRQLEAAREANKVLALQQQVALQTARTRLLYVLLLISGLIIVASWAYRTKRSQLKFQKLARRDGLTGIANRQHFFDTAQDALRYCAKASRPASVLAMDLDHFKSVNDMHGHAAGDEALRRVVAVCESRLRSIDIFGRLGGEEFAILMPDCNENTAAVRAEEMRADIASLPRFDAYADVLVTASFGVASSSNCGYNLATLLAHADNALYQAKHAGRNKVVRNAIASAPA